MSSETLVLEVESRDVTGKKVKQLRRDGKVPATVYEKGKESMHIAIPYLPLSKIWHKAGKSQPIEMTIDKQKHLTMIKDVRLDPVKHQIVHVEFHAVNIKEKIEAEVALKMVGQAPASQLGLLVRLAHDTVMVKGLPTHIPEVIEVDISAISTADDDVRASDLTVPSDIELLAEPDDIIVTVTVPRAEVEKEAEEEVAAADVPSDKGGEKPEATA